MRWCASEFLFGHSRIFEQNICRQQPRALRDSRALQAGSKLEKAKKFGVKILSDKEFRAL